MEAMTDERGLRLTSHRDGQQLEDPEVEPNLDQPDGPGQQDEVDVAGLPTAFLFQLEAGLWGEREARRGGDGAF